MEKYPTKVPIVVRMTDGTIHKLLVEKSGKFDRLYIIYDQKIIKQPPSLIFFY